MSFINFIRANASWLGAGFLLALLSSFGQTFFISIFSGALRNEFDLTHAEWGATYALGTFSSAVVMVWAGGLSDQFRTRYLGVFVLLGARAKRIIHDDKYLCDIVDIGDLLFALLWSGDGNTTVCRCHVPLVFGAARARAVHCEYGICLG